MKDASDLTKDTNLDQWTERFPSFQSKGSDNLKNDSIKYRHSLNKECRKRELQRITKENHQILRRIQDARPTYNHRKWEEEARVNKQILANICEFKPKDMENFDRFEDDDILIDCNAFG